LTAKAETRQLGAVILAVGLAAGLIDLFAEPLGIVDGARFGWGLAVLFSLAAIAIVGGLVLAYVPTALLNPRAVAQKIGHPLLFGAGFLIGLAIRAAFVGRYGTQDPGTVLGWGQAVATNGLADAYQGFYFPVLYQVFGSIVALTEHFEIRSIVALKAVNIACDLGIFTLIVVLLQRWAVNPAYALVYWLAPYVMGLDWLGYTDFEVGFFALLTVVIVSFGSRPVDFLIAGIPLGVTLLMKPEAYMLFAVLVLFVLARAALDRRVMTVRNWVLLFVAPVVMVGIYSLYFGVSGHGYRFLPSQYVGTTHSVPSFSGNMPNIWHVIGEFYRQGENSVYTVTHPSIYHVIAAISTMAILAAFAIVIARTAGQRSEGMNMLLLFAVASLVVPMTMTQAHENHLFLGAAFSSLVMVIARDRRFTIALSALLLLAFVNLYARYGLDAGWRPFAPEYTYPLQFAMAVITTATFAVLALQLARVARSPIGSERLTAR
jgi:hypothetical protein